MDKIWGKYLNLLTEVGREVKREYPKSPMQIVGAASYIHREQQSSTGWDTFLFFLPTEEPWWHVVSVSFRYVTDLPHIVNVKVGRDTSIQEAMKKALHGPVDEVFDELNPKLRTWINNAIYRCPKISLTDVLHLQPYKKEA